MKLAVCTCIKNERKFLEEWIKHNLSIGVDTIFLFEDFFSESHTDICDKFGEKVILRRVLDVLNMDPDDAFKAITNIQININEWFAENYKNQYEWCAFIDVDEFIVTDGESLKDILKEFSNEKGLALSWKWYNANGVIHNDYTSVVNTFTKPNQDYSYDDGWQFKTIVNLKNGGRSEKVHSCNGPVNVLHQKIDVGERNNNIHRRAWINHYFTKSWEDWCNRIFKRGDVVRYINRTLDDFFMHNPEMLNIKDQLYALVEGMIPFGTGFYNRRKRILCGGNINRIKRLNDKYDGHKTII